MTASLAEVPVIVWPISSWLSLSPWISVTIPSAGRSEPTGKLMSKPEASTTVSSVLSRLNTGPQVLSAPLRSRPPLLPPMVSPSISVKLVSATGFLWKAPLTTTLSKSTVPMSGAPSPTGLELPPST